MLSGCCLVYLFCEDSQIIVAKQAPFLLCTLAFPLSLSYLRGINSKKHGADSITVVVVGKFRQLAGRPEND
jgi:hypothetical protein